MWRQNLGDTCVLTSSLGSDRTVVWCQGRASLDPGEAPNSIEKELRDSILCLSFFICKMENYFFLELLIAKVL